VQFLPEEEQKEALGRGEEQESVFFSTYFSHSFCAFAKRGFKFFLQGFWNGPWLMFISSFSRSKLFPHPLFYAQAAGLLFPSCATKKMSEGSAGETSLEEAFFHTDNV
jgi:hypothetical protein